jgi:hypothetical protein
LFEKGKNCFATSFFVSVYYPRDTDKRIIRIPSSSDPKERVGVGAIGNSSNRRYLTALRESLDTGPDIVIEATKEGDAAVAITKG